MHSTPAWCVQELQYEMDSLQAHRQASDYGDTSSRDGDSVVFSPPPLVLTLGPPLLNSHRLCFPPLHFSKMYARQL